jgi:hypothetical protein
LGEGFVEAVAIFVVEFAVVVDADEGYFHEVLEHFFAWFAVKIPDNKGITLYISYQLLLLLQYVLEVLHVRVRVLLLHELLDEFLLGDFCQPL